MTLLFVRHGESLWNVENKICGQTDIPLTEKGYQQAKEAAQLILKEEKQPDIILASPLMRAYETARVISKKTGIPLRTEERLREQNFGIYESTPRNSEEFHLAKMKFLNRFETGESMMQVSHRIYSLLDEIKSDPDHTYLLVAHNGIARHIQSYFYPMTNEEFASFGIRNCEVLKYDFSEYPQE